jgi:hypothetical protein
MGAFALTGFGATLRTAFGAGLAGFTAFGRVFALATGLGRGFGFAAPFRPVVRPAPFVFRGFGMRLLHDAFSMPAE